MQAGQWLPCHPGTTRAAAAALGTPSLTKNTLLKIATIAAVGSASTGIAAGAAHAQSSVSIYGFLDAGIYKLSERPVSQGNIQRSYLGFKGIEDFGNGYRATFTLVSRFDLDTGRLESSGATPLFYGESTVGLAGPFGHVRVGRALTPMWARDGNFDPWYNFDRVASVAWQIYHPSYRSDPYNNGPNGDYNRVNNSVFYDTPEWRGWSVHLSAGGDRNRVPDAAGNIERKRSMGGALNYDQGPLAAMLSAERNSADDRTYFVAGAVAVSTQSRLMLTGSLTQLSEASRVFLGETRDRRSSVTFGATHRIDANTLKLGLGRDFQGYGTRGATNYASAGVEHALSKRTSAYVGVGYRKPENYRSGMNVGVGMSHGF